MKSRLILIGTILFLLLIVATSGAVITLRKRNLPSSPQPVAESADQPSSYDPSGDTSSLPSKNYVEARAKTMQRIQQQELQGRFSNTH